MKKGKGLGQTRTSQRFLFCALILPMVYFGLHLADLGCHDNNGFVEDKKEDELEEMPQVRWELGD